MSETNGGSGRSDPVVITAIIVGGLIILACICASAAVFMTFLSNAPW